MAQKRSDKSIERDKSKRMMNAVIRRASYYRSNPHRFATEYLGLLLKLFLKILLWAMMFNDNFMFIAARGIGKTYLVALFSVIRCILYPGTKIVATASTYKQAREIILKITDDFMHKSPLLCAEISSYSIGLNDCFVKYKNGSYIRVYVANENSRGARSNILIIDESRMIPQKIIDTIFRPMNATPRQPGYLKNPKYAHLQEMNKEMYMSSAWYSSSELYDKMRSYAANMLDPKYKYFVCDLPYSLSIKEGLLMRELIESEMSELTFSSVTFSMEREGLFYGAADNALFAFDDVNKRRVLADGLKPLEFYRDNNLHVPEKQSGEIRILSLDVALLASKKHNNDASALMIHQGMLTEDNVYIDNIVMIDTQEGINTDDLGLLTMRWYYQYDCDFIAIDTNGLGIGVFDYLMSDRFDPLYGQRYDALDCINSPEMSERCKVKGAKKAIYSIKASLKFNNDACIAFRNAILNGYVNLLVNDLDGETVLSKMRGYSKQSEKMQTMLKLPYVQTSFLVNELINLTHDISNNLVKVRERSGMRKDRYSSAIYGYYVIQERSKSLKPKEAFTKELVYRLTMKSAKYR